MDRILTAKTIITMDPQRSRAQAVAVSGERIVAVGTLDECRAALPKAEVVDTGAGALLPGFIDSHSHPILGGAAILPPSYWVAPWFQPTWDDLVTMFKKTQAEHDDDVPLCFFGFDNLLQGHKNPNRDDLDEIFGDRMVMLVGESGHTAYVTSAVIKKLGWDENPPEDPVGGFYERRSDGKTLEGIAWEVPAVMALCAPVLEYLSTGTGHPLEGAVGFYALMASTGITATSEHTYNTHLKAGYEELAKLPSSPLRITLYHMSTEADANEPFVSDVPENMLRKAGVKLWADGAPWAGNIATSLPYQDTPVTEAAGINPGATGEDAMNYTRKQLDEIVDKFAPAGWQLAFHVNGDVGLDVVLDSFSRALDAHGLRGTDHRWRVEHIGAARSDQFPRMASLGVVPSMGPYQVYYWGDLLDGGIFDESVGSRWQRGRDAFNAGLKVSFHNDGSVSPPAPLLNIQAMVTRRGWRTNNLHGPDQAVTLDEALAAQTINAAYALRNDKNIGSIEAGKLADFVAIAADPYEVDPNTIGDIEVLGTWLGGEKIEIDTFITASKEVDPQGLEHIRQLSAMFSHHHDHGQSRTVSS